MKNDILALMNQTNYKGMDIHELADYFDCHSGEKFKQLVKQLVELEDDGMIIMQGNNRYFAKSNPGILTGKVLMNAKGYAFIDIEDQDEDIYVSKDHLNGALNSDIVEVQLLDKHTGQSTEGKVIRIIERGFHQVVGLIVERKGKLCCLSDDAKFKEIIQLDGLAKGVVAGHKVVVELTSYVYPYRGVIKKILGHKNDPGVDILSIVAKYDLNTEFPDEVMAEVDGISDHVLEEEYKGRVDFRNEMIITIDGDDSMDFDDAISLRRLDKHYLLGVHIADVSHYVKEGSPLDKEAIERGTSVYLVDRVIPMLPHKLSNGICSLNPDVDRLTISCMMEIDEFGEVLNHTIVPSVIHSKHRMTYRNVNRIYDRDRDALREYSDIVDMLFAMKELADILREKRENKGAIDFNVNEAKIIVDKKGKAIDVALRERGISEHVIEEFMLAANETVAEHFYHLDIPFIYRVHEHPQKKKLQNFATIASKMGYQLRSNLDNIYPKELSAFIEQARDTPEQTIISTLLLRCMQKARYDVQCLGHFGLADDYYTHFTSPIRRYPDLLVHRMITKYLFENHIDAKTCEHFEKVLPDLAKSSSDREIDAMNCEREVNDMKMAEYMQKHIGETYEGIISSVTSFGFFVELPNTIEGLVHISSLNDDYYVYNDQYLMLIGERTGHQYKMSDHVKVKVVSVNKLEGEIDFELVSNKPKHDEKRENSPKKALKRSKESDIVRKKRKRR